MKRFRMIGVALVAVFALGVVASAAQAETAPYFTVNGTRLVAGKTHNITAKSTKNFVLVTPAAGVEIECTALTAEKGVLLGSNPGERGKDNEITKFTGCKLTKGNGEENGCKLESETLTTNELLSEQVENVSGGRGGKQLLEEFRPAPGSTGFITIKFTGGTVCVAGQTTTVSGQTVAEVVTDGTEEKVELGQAAKEATSWKIRFPATGAIEEVWLISGGVGKVQKTEQTSFSDFSEQRGTALVTLANTKFEAESVNWSPLP